MIFGAAVRPDGTPSTTLRRRVEAALAFGRAHPGALYVPTGAVGRHGPSEASVMAEVLRTAGTDPARVVLEETGTDTLSSARACARLLRARRAGAAAGPTRVVVATSAYHLPRCVALMRVAGFDAQACPPPRVPAASGLRKRWYWRLREAAAFPYDVALAIGFRILGRF